MIFNFMHVNIHSYTLGLDFDSLGLELNICILIQTPHDCGIDHPHVQKR